MASVARPVELEQSNDELPPVIWVTPEEGRQMFDETARQLMGISGEDFVRRWESGEYQEVFDKPGFLHIGYLGSLIPFAR